MTRQWIIVFLTSVALAGAGESPVRVSRYDVIAKGLRVGRVETKRARVEREGKPYVKCEVKTDIKVNLLFYRYARSSRETTFADEGGVVEYSREETVDGAKVSVHGALKDGVFHFDVVENGAARSVDIPRDSYECASVDAPEQHLSKSGDSRTLKILSVDKQAVLDRTYTLSAGERVKVNGKNIKCRVVAFSDTFKTGRRWFTMDDLGLCIMRQEGRDPAGAYTLRMTSNDIVPLPVAVAR